MSDAKPARPPLSGPWIMSADRLSVLAPESGHIVARASAEAMCGRQGDYYGCSPPRPKVRLFIEPAALPIILAAPELATQLQADREFLRSLQVDLSIASPVAAGLMKQFIAHIDAALAKAGGK